MEDILRKTEEIMNCADCSWDKLCIYPPKMTTEEMEAKLPKIDMDNPPKSEREANAKMMSGLVDLMLNAGKDTQCQVCSQVAKKLRKDRTIVDAIRKVMKGENNGTNS